MRPVLHGIIDNMLRLVLNVSRIVVDPRQGHTFTARIFGVPGIGRSDAWLVGSGRCTEVKLIDIDLIEGLVKVLFRATFEELRLDLGFGYFSDCDWAELVEALVAYLAVEDNFLCGYIGPVDMAEDSDVFGTSAQRKSDCQGVAVTARKQAVLGNVLKGSPLFERGQFIVNVYVHYLRDLGDLLRMSLLYSSCACWMPWSPVTVFTVTKGSFSRESRRSRTAKILSLLSVDDSGK